MENLWGPCHYLRNLSGGAGDDGNGVMDQVRIQVALWYLLLSL